MQCSEWRKKQLLYIPCCSKSWKIIALPLTRFGTTSSGKFWFSKVAHWPPRSPNPPCTSRLFRWKPDQMDSHCPLLNSTSGHSWQPAVWGNGCHWEYECSISITTKEEDTGLENWQWTRSNVPCSERNKEFSSVLPRRRLTGDSKIVYKYSHGKSAFHDKHSPTSQRRYKSQGINTAN